MKKIAYIFVALLAFAVGTSVFYIRPFFIHVPLSKLNKNIEEYKFRRIKVKGNFVAANEGSSYFYRLDDDKDKCVAADVLECYSSIRLELSEEVKNKQILLIKEIIDRNSNLKGSELEEGEYRVEVELFGYIDEYKDVISGAWHPPTIKVEEMEQISPVKFIKIQRIS